MILHWLSGGLRCRIISDDGTPYLERYYLGQLWGMTFYLHRFVGSDPDRGWHDHPWRWAASFVLRGWYWEDTRQFQQQQRIRWFNFLLGDSFHRVVLPEGRRDVWTLFAHSTENVKPWGFLRKRGDGLYSWHRYPRSNMNGQW